MYTIKKLDSIYGFKPKPIKSRVVSDSWAQTRKNPPSEWAGGFDYQFVSSKAQLI